MEFKRSLDVSKRFLYTGKEQRREAKEAYEEKCERKLISKALSKPRWCPELEEWPAWNSVRQSDGIKTKILSGPAKPNHVIISNKPVVPVVPMSPPLAPVLPSNPVFQNNFNPNPVPVPMPNPNYRPMPNPNPMFRPGPNTNQNYPNIGFNNNYRPNPNYNPNMNPNPTFMNNYGPGQGFPMMLNTNMFPGKYPFDQNGYRTNQGK